MKYGYFNHGDLIPSIDSFTEGAYILVVCSPTDYISKAVALEDLGWTVRDCIKVLLKNKSSQVGLFRKPFKGTVANNVLTNGCGGINIDICRIRTNDIIESGRKNRGECKSNSYGKGLMGIDRAGQNQGRFPANLLLKCTCEEVIEGKSEGVVINNSNSPNFTDDVYCGGWNRGEQEAPRAYKDTGAIHTDSNCPCKKLDLESGIRKSAGGRAYQNTNDMFSGGYAQVKGVKKDPGFGDIGGASRFFFNFADENMLKEYLINLIEV